MRLDEGRQWYTLARALPGVWSDKAPRADTGRRVRSQRLVALERELLGRPVMPVRARGCWTHERPDAVVEHGRTKQAAWACSWTRV